MFGFCGPGAGHGGNRVDVGWAHLSITANTTLPPSRAG
jgi:hypothetical protein